MPTRLSLPQQRAMIKALPAHRIMAVKNHCQSCDMKGQGIKDILKTISGVLGPIIKEVGPTVLRELIIPFIKKKIQPSGKGIHIAGSGLSLPGMGLRLAGQRGHGKKPKKVINKK